MRQQRQLRCSNRVRRESQHQPSADQADQERDSQPAFLPAVLKRAAQNAADAGNSAIFGPEERSAEADQRAADDC